MPSWWTQETGYEGATAPKLRAPHLIVLQDHARLPWRFFGRLTAGLHAGL